MEYFRILFTLYFLFALVFAYPSVSIAQSEKDGLNWELSLTQAYSDNIALTGLDPVEDFPTTAAGEFSWSSEGRRAETDFSVAAQRIIYLENTFDDETRTQIDAEILFEIAPERLSWRFSDVFQQEPINVRDQFNPSNNQDINVFETGPQLRLPFGSRTRIEASASHLRSKAEVTREFDSTSNSGSFGLVLVPSSRTQFALRNINRRVEFDDNEANDDYDRQDTFIELVLDRGQTKFTVEAGLSSIDFESTIREIDDANLFRMEMEREIGTSRRFVAEFHDNLTDAASSIADGGSLNEGSAIVSGDIFRDRGWSAAFEGEWTGGGWGFLVGQTDEEGVENPLLGRKSDIFSSGLTLDLTSRLSLVVLASAANYEFTEINRLDEERQVVTTFLYNTSPNVVLSLELGHTDTDSTDPDFDIRESNVALTIAVRR